MKIIDFNTIYKLGIDPKQCVEWVKNVFIHKYESELPPKISISLPNDRFINTMPCMIPEQGVFGVKVVSRYPERQPALQAEIMLYDIENGNLLAIMDASWITTMRTGAVAALAVDTLKKKSCKEISIIGLGNTARATLLCLNSMYPDQNMSINLYSYKGQELQFINRFKDFTNLKFNIYNNVEDLFAISDVIISCITAANNIFAEDNIYKQGVLLVPVHTRGFQNCDLFFDKVFADDTAHVTNFKNFNSFKNFDEFSQIILKKNKGRESDNERIISYNIGIALHDIYFATKIYRQIEVDSTPLSMLNDKYWV